MSETFAQYRARVLGYLGSRDPIRVQRQTPRRLERFLTGRSRGVLTRRPAENKWSITEVVAHMADAELAMSWRLRNMISSPGVSLSWWDESVWASRLRYQQVPWRDSFERFKSLRLGNLALLRSLSPREWDVSYGTHKRRGRQTVRDFVILEAAHDLNHLRQIKSMLREA